MDSDVCDGVTRGSTGLLHRIISIEKLCSTTREALHKAWE